MGFDEAGQVACDAPGRLGAEMRVADDEERTSEGSHGFAG